MSNLALFGGPKVRMKPFPNHEALLEEDIQAAVEALRNGPQTGYRGTWKEHRGGPRVRALEELFCAKFGVKHAIACNSATSGLFVALGAVLGPIWGQLVRCYNRGYLSDDWHNCIEKDASQVIVSPYSMSCSASLPLAWGARPVFADVDDTGCLDPADVERRITESTRAILAVSLFGQPFDYRLRELADARGIPIIEDAAQAIGSYVTFGPPVNPQSGDLFRYNRFAGTFGHIGVYSFNQGKQISIGEGGMIVTDSDEYAERCRLLVNHGEAVVHDARFRGAPEAEAMLAKHSSLYGFNLRLPEVSAAIALSQMTRLDDELDQRRHNAGYLRDHICKEVECIGPMPVRAQEHSYYVLPLIWHADAVEEVTRDRFIEAVRAELMHCEGRLAEGVTVRAGYTEPLYSLPVFNLPKGTCPNCERLQGERLVIIYKLFGPRASRQDLDDVIESFAKVWRNKGELR